MERTEAQRKFINQFFGWFYLETENQPNDEKVKCIGFDIVCIINFQFVKQIDEFQLVYILIIHNEVSL